MADYRPIKQKIWHDNWFLSLTPEEKLLWIFLLTNEYVHISGIYELPKPLISPLTGVTNPLPILEKFEKDGKIIIKEGYIFIRNYLKNQTKQINKKDNITISIINYIAENSHFIDLFNLENEIFYKPLISPLQAPTPPLPKVLKIKVLKIKEESNKEINIATSHEVADKDPINLIFEIFYKSINPTINFGNKTNRDAAKFLIDKFGLKEIMKLTELACSVQGKPYAPTITTPYQLKEKLSALGVYLKKENSQSKSQMYDRSATPNL